MNTVIFTIIYLLSLIAPIITVGALTVCMFLDIREHERIVGERNIVKQNSYGDEDEFDF